MVGFTKFRFNQSMSYFNWENKLSVHVKAMDDEHKVLIDKMNALYDAHAAQKNFAQLTPLVNDLVNFAVKHFADEEAYMEKINYPGLATHKIVHKNLLKQVGEHVDNFKSTQKMSGEFFTFLKVWLSSHIMGIDMKYGKSS